MTWVVGVLLALNLGLLTWNLHMRTATPVAPGQQGSEHVPAEITQLRLLSELSADALRPRASAMSTAAVADSAPELSQAAAIANDVAPVPAMAIAGASAARVTLTGRGAAASGAAQAVPVVIGLADNKASEIAAPAIESRACFTLGPLSVDAPIEKLRAWLQDAGATVDVRADERREMTVYWVFFPPRTSRAEAIADVERLHGAGFKDVIAVRKGDMANAISLGVFSRSESRDRRVKEMNVLGFQPSVEPRYQVKLATWVDVSAPAEVLSDRKILTRWPGLRVGRMSCGGVAIASERSAMRPIAVSQEASYNANLPAPRRFFFSGSDDSQPSGTSDVAR